VNKRQRLRLWLFALDRFELSLRTKAGKERNRFIRVASEAYERTGSVPAYVTTAHRQQIADILAAHYRRVIPHFAATALDGIKSRPVGMEFKQDLFASLTQEWIAREALRKASLIAATDLGDITSALEAGMAEGLGTAEIARNIRKVSQLTPHRAATVARTETHAAATYAASESAAQAQQEFGITLLKEWLPTLDARTRPEHAAMASHPPIPLNEKFTVGGELMDRPGDPSASAANQVNCRCAIAYIEAE
jgi:hypothetical protein